MCDSYLKATDSDKRVEPMPILDEIKLQSDLSEQPDIHEGKIIKKSILFNKNRIQG